MADLSPAAQAVLDAYKEASDGHYIDGEWVQDHAGQVAAALRAVAKQSDFADVAVNKTVEVVLVEHLLAIAAELEGTTG